MTLKIYYRLSGCQLKKFKIRYLFIYIKKNDLNNA